MNSEDGSSLPPLSTESISVATARSSVEKTSGIAQYLREAKRDEPIRNEANRKLYYCNLCTDYSATSTTNMGQHLSSKHQIIVDKRTSDVKSTASDQLEQLWRQASASNIVAEFNSHVMKSVLNKEVVTKALVNLICIRNLSVGIVMRPEFHAFCQALNPESSNIVTTAHSEITKAIDEEFQLKKDTVRKRLQSALTHIHLSLDIWTSPNYHSLMAICAHFLDSQERRLNCLLALRTVANHSGEERFNILRPVLQEYGIVHKVGAIVADNSTTNDTLCRQMSQYLNDDQKISWDFTHQRIRCQVHTINLIVQAFLFTSAQASDLETLISEETVPAYEEEATKQQKFRNMGVLGRLHNIVIHSRSSESRVQQFRSLAGRLIPVDNSTRWNSWYQMLSVAIEKQSAIDAYVQLNFEILRKDYISPADWQTLNNINSFLQPFYKATMITQGDRATLDSLLFSMDVLGKHMEKSIASNRNNKYIIHRIQQALKKFEEYYRKTNNSPLYALALILNPERRIKHAKLFWKKDYQKAILPVVEKFWVEYQESTNTVNPVEDYKTPVLTPPQPLDQFDLIASEFNERVTRPASQDEYEDYNCEAPYEIQISPLQWWCESSQRKRWPRLSKLAIDILSIPAISDEPERFFSGGRRTMSWESLQIGAATLEKTECLKSWHMDSTSILDEESSTSSCD